MNCPLIYDSLSDADEQRNLLEVSLETQGPLDPLPLQVDCLEEGPRLQHQPRREQQAQRAVSLEVVVPRPHLRRPQEQAVVSLEGEEGAYLGAQMPILLQLLRRLPHPPLSVASVLNQQMQLQPNLHRAVRCFYVFISSTF